jgi:hypothetical protein
VLLALVAVGAGWKMIRVGAQGTGSVVRLSVEMEGRSEPAICYLSVVDSSDGGCGFGGKTSVVGFRAAGRTADAVRLLVKTTIHTRPSEASVSMSDTDAGVEQQSSREMLLVPGEPLKIQVEGMGTVTVRAEWLDHRPPWLATQGNIDPGPTQLRISNPFLLKDDARISDITANASVGNGLEHGVAIVFPNAGRYVLSLTPIKDAVEGNIKENRIDFEYNGAKYVLLTGAPIARQEKAWVLVQPNYKDPNCRGCYGVSMPDIRSLAIEK